MRVDTTPATVTVATDELPGETATLVILSAATPRPTTAERRHARDTHGSVPAQDHPATSEVADLGHSKGRHQHGGNRIPYLEPHRGSPPSTTTRFFWAGPRRQSPKSPTGKSSVTGATRPKSWTRTGARTPDVSTNTNTNMVGSQPPTEDRSDGGGVDAGLSGAHRVDRSGASTCDRGEREQGVVGGDHRRQLRGTPELLPLGSPPRSVSELGCQWV